MRNEAEREAFETAHKILHPQIKIRQQNLVGTYTDAQVDHAAFWFQAGAEWQRTQAQPAEKLAEALENTATWIEQLPVPTVGAAGQLVKIDKAIAAYRNAQGEK